MENKEMVTVVGFGPTVRDSRSYTARFFEGTIAVADETGKLRCGPMWIENHPEVIPQLIEIFNAATIKNSPGVINMGLGGEVTAGAIPNICKILSNSVSRR